MKNCECRDNCHGDPLQAKPLRRRAAEPGEPYSSANADRRTQQHFGERMDVECQTREADDGGSYQRGDRGCYATEGGIGRTVCGFPLSRE